MSWWISVKDHPTRLTKLLECMEDNFLTQLMSEPTRDGALLYNLLVHKEGLEGDVKAGGCLGHSDHKMIVFNSWKSKEGG